MTFTIRSFPLLCIAVHCIIQCGAFANDLPKTDDLSTKESTQPLTQLHKPLPEPLTSFGAAVLGEYLYVFSGHDGDAHGFGKEMLVDHFRRLRFDDPNAEWEELAMHDSAQSTALVSDGEHLYRIGGLSFRKTQESDKSDFDSTTFFTRYNIKKDQWDELPSLPQGRSSHDAAVLGRTVYAVGGWDLQGDDTREAFWHDKVHAFDLDNPKDGWREIDGPGYSLRAMSVAAHKGKLYVIGGMGPSGFLRTTSIYDPSTDLWTKGPDLVSDSSMSGFATSMFAVSGKLYWTGASGIVYRLAADGKEWEVANRLLFPRMFLRLLPAGSERLLAVAGTGSLMGRTSSVESVYVGQGKEQEPKIVSWTLPNPGSATEEQTTILDGIQLYSFGGKSGSDNGLDDKTEIVREAFAFNIAKQTTKKLADLPTPNAAGIGFVHRKNSESSAYVIAGGETTHTSSSKQPDPLLDFDPNTEQWTALNITLPKQFTHGKACTREDAIWFFPDTELSEASPNQPTPVLHWWGDDSPITPVPGIQLPRNRRAFGGASIGDEYFLVGGSSPEGTPLSVVDVFNFNSRKWREASSPEHARMSPSLAVHRKKLYLFGGTVQVDGNQQPCSTLEVYDSETDEWKIIATDLPHTAPNMKMHSLAGRLLFCGIDPSDGHKLRFTIFDPEPKASPQIAKPLDFSNHGTAVNVTDSVKAVMRRDENKDGVISEDEIGKRMKSFFMAADKNGDRSLSYAEVQAELEAEANKETESEND